MLFHTVRTIHVTVVRRDALIAEQVCQLHASARTNVTTYLVHQHPTSALAHQAQRPNWTANMVMQAWGDTHDVAGLGVVGQEVQHAPALLDVLPRAGLQAVHQVHELDAVADEEHGDVVLQMHQRNDSACSLAMTSAADVRPRCRLHKGDCAG